MNGSIKQWKEDERPREKIIAFGSKVLSDAELLAIIISTGTKQKSAIDLSKEVLEY
jgi:DNA repair protein RadC